MAKFNAEMDWFDTRGELGLKVSCSVEFISKNIHVVYRDQLGQVCDYSGSDQGYGHYKLRCNHSSGDGTLHRFVGADGSIEPDVSHFLEGHWRQDGAIGLWRVQLIGNI